eukprot:6036691-Amphidinium_carterae.1
MSREDAVDRTLAGAVGCNLSVLRTLTTFKTSPSAFACLCSLSHVMQGLGMPDVAPTLGVAVLKAEQDSLCHNILADVASANMEKHGNIAGLCRIYERPDQYHTGRDTHTLFWPIHSCNNILDLPNPFTK